MRAVRPSGTLTVSVSPGIKRPGAKANGRIKPLARPSLKQRRAGNATLKAPKPGFPNERRNGVGY